MKKLSPLVLFIICLFISTLDMSALQFDKSEYAERRTRLMKELPDGIIIIAGARSRTDFYPFVQNNNFLYLTGVKIPNAYLVIDPSVNETVLFARLTEFNIRDNGESIEMLTDPVAYTGIAKVMKPEEMSQYLREKAERVKTFYTCLQPEELPRECTMEKMMYQMQTIVKNEWDGGMTPEQRFAEQLKSKYTGITVNDCSNNIHNLRIIKSKAEIELLRKAGRIGVEAHKAVMKAIRPGIKEYELAALFEYECKRAGAQDLAYYTVLCSGVNHLNVHYHGYDRTLTDGDFLVVDAGPDLANYDIDITVSFPANGKFTPRQKEIYEAANAVHEASMKVFRPGIDLKQANEEISAILTRQGFDMNSDLMKRLNAGFGHYVGMAVHDVGGSPSVLKPGMVFANEPYTVFKDENLGVRVEDTILITETGCENLTPGIPRTVKEIEAFMTKK
jgi:Xaa-Pro aminopeptidase